MAMNQFGKRALSEAEQQELRAIARRLVDGKTTKVALTSFVPDLSSKLKTVLREEFGFKGNIKIVRTGETSRYDVLVKGGLRKINQDKPAKPAPEPRYNPKRQIIASVTAKEYTIPDTVGEALRGKDVYALSQAKGSLLLLLRSNKLSEPIASEAKARLAEVENRLTEVGGAVLTYKLKAEETRPLLEIDQLYAQKKQLRHAQSRLHPGDQRYADAQKKINLIDGKMSQLHADEYYKKHYQTKPKQILVEYPIFNAPPARVSPKAPNKTLKKRGRKKQEVPLQQLGNKGKNIPDTVLTPKEAEVYSNMQMLASRGILSKAELARASGVKERSLPSYLSRLRANGLPIPLERRGRAKATAPLGQKMTRRDARMIIEEHGMPAQQLIEIQRHFVREQGLRTKPTLAPVRYWDESAKGMQLKKELRHARAISKPGSTGLEAVGLSRKTLDAMQESWLQSIRERAKLIEAEKKAIRRRKR